MVPDEGMDLFSSLWDVKQQCWQLSVTLEQAVPPPGLQARLIGADVSPGLRNRALIPAA